MNYKSKILRLLSNEDLPSDVEKIKVPVGAGSAR